MSVFKRCVLLILGMSAFWTLPLLVCQDDDESIECDRFLCGSVVSKCLLTQSCQCKLSDCHCCKKCILCLGRLFTDCCGCLGMCPKQNRTQLSTRSQIGDFEGVPGLFESLVEDKSHHDWTVVQIPMRESLESQLPNSINQEEIMEKLPISYQSNCTLVYLKTCIGLKKCTKYCESLVSASCYRNIYICCH